MKRWKYAVSSLFLAATVVSAFYSWHQSPQQLLTRAEQSFENGDYLLSLKQLQRLEAEDILFAPKLILMQSYALREQGFLGRSTQKILLGLSLFPHLQRIPEQKEKEIALELALGLSLNGYNTDNISDFTEGVRIAYMIEPENAWVALFKMIEQANKNDWEGVHLWLENQKPRKMLSPWMNKPFNRTFTKDQEILLLARAHIERGQTVLAREMLEQLEETTAILDERTYLMALSYLFDARERSDNVAMGYYRLALSFLEPLDLQQPHWKKYLARVSDFFANEALEQLLFNEEKSQLASQDPSTTLDDLTDHLAQENFTFFIQALSRWHADQHLEVLARHFIDSLVRIEKGDIFPQFEQIQHSILERDPRWRPHIENELLLRLEQSLLEGKWDRVQQFWTMCINPSTVFSGQFNIDAAKRIQNRVYQKYVETVQLAATGQDTSLVEEQLEALAHYLPLLHTTQTEMDALAQTTMRLAEHTAALFSGQVIAAQTGDFIRILLNNGAVPESQHASLKQFFKEKLNQRFLQAKGQNDLANMSLVFDIAANTDLQVIEVPSEERLANMLADAQYLLDSERLYDAQQLLTWILKITPEHPEAIHLLGSSLFGTGRYDEAKDLLLKINSSHHVLKQMLAISYLKTGEVEKAQKIISQLSPTLISDRLKLESGLVAADNNQWDEAVVWWKSIGAKSDLVSLLQLIAAFRMDSFELVIKTFTSLPANLRIKKEVVSLAIWACLKTDQKVMAHSLLTSALDSKSPPLTMTLKEPLDRFTTPQDRDLPFAAAQFYESVEGAHEKALTLLEKATTGTWEIPVAKARSHIALNQTEKARNLLIEAKKDHKIEMSSVFYSFWETLASIEYQEKSYDKVLYLCEEIENALGRHNGITQIKAKTLASLWDFTKARQEIFPQTTDEFDSLKLQEQLFVLDLLGKEGKYRHFTEYLSSIKTSLLSSELQWKLARYALNPFLSHQIEPMTPSLHSFAQLNSKQKGHALYYLAKTSNLTRASLWSSEHEADLKKSIAGLMAIGKIALENKELERAREYLEKAVLRVEMDTVDHTQLLSLIFLTKELPDLHVLSRLSNKFAVDTSQYYKSTLGEKHLIRSTRLLYFTARSERGHLLTSSEQSEVELFLDDIEHNSFEKKNSPITHWHSYLIYQLKAQPTKAEKELLSLQATAPGMINIHYELALLLMQSRQLQVAQRELDKSEFFFPKSSKVAILRARLALLQLEGVESREVTPQESEHITKLIQTAIERAPYSPYPLLLSAKQAFLQGHMAKAHQELQKALVLRPGLDEANSLLKAVIRKRMKQEGTHIQWQQQLEELEKMN